MPRRFVNIVSVVALAVMAVLAIYYQKVGRPRVEQKAADFKRVLAGIDAPPSAVPIVEQQYGKSYGVHESARYGYSGAPAEVMAHYDSVMRADGWKRCSPRSYERVYVKSPYEAHVLYDVRSRSTERG